MFPVYQNQVQRQYPDARTMVVDWASAGDKIMQGVVTGVNLGLKIKESRENTALRAMQLKQTEAAMFEAKRAGDLNERLTNQRLALDALREQEVSFDLARKQSETAIKTFEANASVQLQRAEASAQAVETLAIHNDSLTDLVANHSDLNDKLISASDFSEKRKIIDLYKTQADEFEAVTGKTMKQIAADLPPNDPRIPILQALSPSALEAQFQNITVPIEMPRLVTTDPSFDALSPEEQESALQMMAMTGKGGVSKTDTVIKFVPLNNAIQMWKSGNSLNTLQGLKETATDKQAFDKWAKSHGLDKIIAEPKKKTDDEKATDTAPQTVTVTTSDGKRVEVANPYLQTPKFVEAVDERFKKVVDASPYQKYFEKGRAAAKASGAYRFAGAGAVEGGLALNFAQNSPELQAEEYSYYERSLTDVKKELRATTGSDVKTLNKKLELQALSDKLQEKADEIKAKYGIVEKEKQPSQSQTQDGTITIIKSTPDGIMKNTIPIARLTEAEKYGWKRE